MESQSEREEKDAKKGIALLEQAKLNLAKRAAETDFNRLVGKEFDLVTSNNELGLRYLHDWMKQDPDRFDN